MKPQRNPGPIRCIQESNSLGVSSIARAKEIRGEESRRTRVYDLSLRMRIL